MDFMVGDLVGNRNGRRKSLPGRLPVNKKRDRGAKQDALVRAGTRLFATKGYEATTTREIAALAGCAEGLIHRYFRGKAGLLYAIMRTQAAEDAMEMSTSLPRASHLDEEIQQLLEWELNRMWKQRDFLRVTIPRAILDRRVGQFVSRVGPGRHSRAIADRLKLYRDNGTALADDDIEAVANTIGALGFALGFMRQVVFGFNRQQTKRLAENIAAVLARAIHSHRP